MIRTLKGQDVAPELLPENWEQDARALLEAIPEKYDEVRVEACFDSTHAKKDEKRGYMDVWVESRTEDPPTKYMWTALIAFKDGRYAGYVADKPSTASECIDTYLKKIDYCFSRPFCKPCGKAMTIEKAEAIERDGKWFIRHTFQCPECEAETQREKEAA